MGKVKIKEQFDNYIYWLHNMVTNSLFSISKNKSLTKNNIKFRNIHYGQKCFILGTGPSLGNIDYCYLKDEITFGVNFLYKGEIINYIKPQYYCLYDPNFYTIYLQETIELINSLPNTTFFLSTKFYNTFKEINIQNKNIYYQYLNLFQYDDNISVDMVKNMTAPFNVILGCIQTAIYMGFREIYLLGCDFNSFAYPKVVHFYDKIGANRTRSLAAELKEYSLVCYHHYALEKYAREKGIYIYNITPNSLLDAYERKNIEEVFFELII